MRVPSSPRRSMSVVDTRRRVTTPPSSISLSTEDEVSPVPRFPSLSARMKAMKKEGIAKGTERRKRKTTECLSTAEGSIHLFSGFGQHRKGDHRNEGDSKEKGLDGRVK
mmetsp:Transcript_29402/g.73206  ORF Transcript_29402/g.73206 Transcript_29402/m.73206 type:complete len:109 (+) Transcript_29402:272-598(+)